MPVEDRVAALAHFLVTAQKEGFQGVAWAALSTTLQSFAHVAVVAMAP